jgi:hypothetical protein
MPTNRIAAPALQDHLAEPLRLGDPDVHGPLAVFPIFGPVPQLGYLSFAQGRAHGAAIKELEDGAAVNDLLVLNPTDHAILLYEGEEVLGAQQNRTFDVSVLVGARSQLQVPVSCVEAHRWDGGRHDESFSPAPQTAYPALRHMKNRATRASVAAGAGPRALQGEVWNEIAGKSARMDVHSDTHAMHDIYDGRRARLDEILSAIRLHDEQTGALVLIGGRPVVLDHVSRPAVFAALHAPLVQGYALDALEHGAAAADGAPRARPGTQTAAAFLRHVLRARITEHDGIGLGRDIRFAQTRVAGAGLVVGDELVQLTAFPEDATGPTAGGDTPAARIRRPSRRRAA